MDTIEAQRTTRSTAQNLPSLPLRLHHHAYVVKDHEANRRFIEDLLGIPLVATWCEKSHNNETGEEIEFCHTFFGLADGSALAFFQFADPRMYERTQAKAPAEIGRYDHIALKVDDRTYEALKARLDAAGEKFRETNHGYCKAIYTNSPDGLIVEFTCDPPMSPRSMRCAAPTHTANWRAGSAATARSTTSCATATSSADAL